MDCNFTTLPYSDTGYFTPIVLDYLNASDQLREFYSHPVSTQGIAAAISARESAGFHHRELLVNVLTKQYQLVSTSDAVQSNIELLKSENTFTVCTAHQPAIFTGTLYFIYKILHTISLCKTLSTTFPNKNFVPVFYMGCEDADLEELGKIFLNGEKIVWETSQQGAVGRMNTTGLEKVMTRIEGELSVLENGKELMSILQDAYHPDLNIQTATFRLIHTLFQKFGLVVLIPDNADLKRVMVDVFKDDLLRHIPSAIVQSTTDRLDKLYKVQANPRDINLFYLDDQKRQRIEKSDQEWRIVNEAKTFSKQELLDELSSHPERFSPNVILRGLFQETILPNIAFIGGGGELAYWLEFKELFQHYQTPFPVLILRNSFLVIEKKWQDKINKLGIDPSLLFKSEDEILKELVHRDTSKKITLADEIHHASSYYDQLKTLAGTVDDTLVQHVSALQSKAIKPLQELEKKLLRAEKRRFETEQRQIHLLKTKLFPLDGLQERIDNFMPYYATWGSIFIDKVFEHSSSLEQRFGIIIEK